MPFQLQDWFLSFGATEILIIGLKKVRAVFFRFLIIVVTMRVMVRAARAIVHVWSSGRGVSVGCGERLSVGEAVGVGVMVGVGLGVSDVTGVEIGEDDMVGLGMGVVVSDGVGLGVGVG